VLIGVALVVVPSKAYVKVDAAPGLRGGFVHKNQMGPAVIMLAAAVLACERRPAVRRGVVIGVVMLLVLGRTTTGLASMMLTVGLYAVLVRYPMVKRKLGRTFQFLMVVMVIASAVAYVIVNRMIISLSGKDLTFSNRTSIWSEVMAAWRSKPLTGYGWSVWQAVFLQPVNGIITRLGFVVAESHNAAVELLFRLGVVGLVLYLLVLLTALVRGLKLVRAGDPVGVFTVLLVALMVTWGFSEALPTSGAWIGLVAVFAVPRPVGNRLILGTARGPRRRLFSPGPQRVR
jgi:exopolysaccharide production protein ExoQ